VWALGLIFYELLHGETPWTAPNAAQLAKNIEKLPLAITRTDLTPET
jgi:serine/threonine protein kinase